MTGPAGGPHPVGSHVASMEDNASEGLELPGVSDGTGVSRPGDLRARGPYGEAMTTTVRTWVTDGGVGRIELDRQRALNALDLSMIRAIRQALEAWRDDGAVGCVVVTGAGRAFCAGGDVRGAREAVLAGRPEDADAFFAEEYALNRAVAEYPRPYIAIVDGICMGGGLGVSVHGAARVVTERAMLAMPETAIGFAPDVGTSHVLPRLEGAAGAYLALSGARLDAAAALESGLATHHVPSAVVPDLLTSLDRDGVDAVDAHRAPPPEPGDPASVREATAEAFSGTSVPEILDRLDAQAVGTGPAREWARRTATTLRSMCPTSLVMAHELLAAGSRASLPECLGNELRAARWLIRRPDFAEGVRAVLVDKDHDAAWSPGRLAEVDVTAVRAVVRGMG